MVCGYLIERIFQNVLLVEVLFFVNICVRIKLFKNGLILKKKRGGVYFTFLK